jgi:hypothetical protein
MKNKIDFIYEYSDLNELQTRVQVLTGEYKDTIVEFGGSNLLQNGSKNVFTFNYELYQIPRKFMNTQLKGNSDFEKFLAYLLVDVVSARKKDKQEHEKLMQAASYFGVKDSKIKIDEKFYPNWLLKAKKQPIAQGLQGF